MLCEKWMQGATLVSAVFVGQLIAACSRLARGAVPRLPRLGATDTNTSELPQSTYAPSGHAARAGDEDEKRECVLVSKETILS